jgi:hypothetical protein
VKKGPSILVDPTKFIPKPLIELPKWVAKCDDYKAIYKVGILFGF